MAAKSVRIFFSCANDDFVASFTTEQCIARGLRLNFNPQWVWGFKADYDAVGSKSYNRSYTYTGNANTGAGWIIPNGTYAINGKVSPNGIGLLGPRIGYAFDQWLPYFRVGAAFAGGQHTSTLSFSPAVGDNPPASAGSISGGKNFKSSGFNVGVGLDYDATGPWSFTAEYNYVNLGKGTNSTFTCTATATICAPTPTSRWIHRRETKGAVVARVPVLAELDRGIADDNFVVGG